MTNRELMMLILKGDADDDGASYESETFYHIACPYYDGDKRAWCSKEKANSLSEIREQCFGCKDEWLDSEVDE